MATLITTGIPEIDRRLGKLATREANRISRSAINKGLTVLAKAERAAIDASGASDDLKRALKKTIGKRLSTKVGSKPGAMAKAGLGVGQRPRTAKARSRAAAKASGVKQDRLDRQRKGVGVSAADVHWFALGTQERYQGTPGGRKRVGRVKPTGIRAAASSGGAVFQAVRATALEKTDAVVKALRGS